MKLLFGIFVLSLAATLTAWAHPQELSPQAPPDRPASVSGAEGVRKFEQAIAPYVRKARATLPQAKKKYLKGLPAGGKRIQRPNASD